MSTQNKGQVFVPSLFVIALFLFGFYLFSKDKFDFQLDISLNKKSIELPYKSGCYYDSEKEYK